MTSASIALRYRNFRARPRSEAAVSANLRLGVCTLIGTVLVLELWARANDYGMRVVSDTPTYVALLYRLSAHPFHPATPYFATGSSSHATPDLQLEALLWRLLHGAGTVNPVAAYRLLALAGLVGTLLVLHAVFIWVRRQAGSRAAWISLPVLLALLGPAHVIWAGDLSVHGFLYDAYFAQTLALAFSLYTLSLLDAASVRRLPLLIVLVALTLLTHPFTGVVLIALICLRSCQFAFRQDRKAWLGPAAFAGGYALAHIWPAYSIAAAISEAGLPANLFVAIALAVPVVVWQYAPDAETAAPAWLPRQLPARATLLLAWAGVAGVTMLIEWQLWLLDGHGKSRLAVYWVVAIGRWALLFAGGIVGLAGLYNLARRGRILPAAWFAAAYGIGVVGALGVHIPLWYRILLFAQVPLALGVSLIAAETRDRSVRLAIILCVAASLIVKAATLLAAPPNATYFGENWLQEGYALSSSIPPGRGTVASDPFTSYFITAATGRSILTLSPAHLGGANEIREADRGYQSLHQLYDGSQWWQSAQQLYRSGVRYVVVDHSLSLSSPTLEQFVINPPRISAAGGPERRRLGVYFHRLNQIGQLVSDSRQFAVYRLDGLRLAGAGPGSWLEDGSRLVRAIPPGRDTIASDPLTGYRLRAATGRAVLTLPPLHLRTASAARDAEHGYLLLHELYDGQNWWAAAAELYRKGVRFVVVDHAVSLSSPTLEQFVAQPPMVNAEGGLERRLLGGYFHTLNRIGNRVFDSASYTLYRLNGRRLGAVTR